MLQTGLEHVESQESFESLLKEHENVMLCCGRMGPMCLPVYDIMENLRDEYPEVAFRDMDFDGPASHLVRRLPEVRSFTGLPFTLYYKDGKLVEATSSIQTRSQVTSNLDRLYRNGG